MHAHEQAETASKLKQQASYALEHAVLSSTRTPSSHANPCCAHLALLELLLLRPRPCGLPPSLVLAMHARQAGPATGPRSAPSITPCRPPPSPHLAAAFSPAKPASSRALQCRRHLSYKLAAVHVDAELPRCHAQRRAPLIAAGMLAGRSATAAPPSPPPSSAYK